MEKSLCDNVVCERVVRDNVVCERVVCDKDVCGRVCVTMLCVKELRRGGERRAESATERATEKQAPHINVGNKPFLCIYCMQTLSCTHSTEQHRCLN